MRHLGHLRFTKGIFWQENKVFEGVSFLNKRWYPENRYQDRGEGLG